MPGLARNRPGAERPCRPAGPAGRQACAPVQDGHPDVRRATGLVVAPGHDHQVCGRHSTHGWRSSHLIGFTMSERIRSVVRAAVFRSTSIEVMRVMSATRAQVLPSAQAQTG